MERTKIWRTRITLDAYRIMRIRRSFDKSLENIQDGTTRIKLI